MSRLVPFVVATVAVFAAAPAFAEPLVSPHGFDSGISRSTVLDNTPMSGVGHNSLSTRDATRRLMSHGYSSVDSLISDGKGGWHGLATINGVRHNVGVDSNGSVTTR